MTTTPQSRKTYTAELQRLHKLGLDGGGGDGQPLRGDPRVLSEVESLRDEVRVLSHLLRNHVLPPEETEESEEAEKDPLLAEYERQRAEVRVLKMELRALANSIQETKREIAHLRARDADTDRLEVVAGELDAVVGATENATHGILEAAEKIDNIAHTLRASPDSYVKQQAEELSDHIMSIYEHSNFQDITGQRITKVVNTLKFVEDRVDRMISIWGQETFQELIAELPEEYTQDDERRLLNGPQLENHGISQDEIDKLFG
ncbi:protein phosphatase CheZ [Novispirillum itersonii]|uniref:Chemotaxis protein CheZ n=1 Tax=Novispirillum itersonii TaxID=189 RepID=A0A7W9ZCE1_NOVIT|nr:protein phosphatase CheZ [Novispirillum itersonii]MBB6208897.1 chemotaxis protein CheZ [Novispirillum itersonii]